VLGVTPSQGSGPLGAEDIDGTPPVYSRFVRIIPGALGHTYHPGDDPVSNKYGHPGTAPVVEHFYGITVPDMPLFRVGAVHPQALGFCGVKLLSVVLN
jgi:hypothetical protein